jgi:hypothetical protein
LGGYFLLGLWGGLTNLEGKIGHFSRATRLILEFFPLSDFQPYLVDKEPEQNMCVTEENNKNKKNKLVLYVQTSWYTKQAGYA